MKFIKTWAAVAALAAFSATSANAALENMNTAGGGALTFLALDAVGTPTSLVVDLGFMLTDFLPSSALTGTGQNVVWNFNTNSLSVNGVAQSGTYNWSAQYAAFQGLAQSAETTYGVISGDNAAFKYLTTGRNVTSAQITNFVDNSVGSNLSVVDTLYANNGNKGTFTLAGDGASAAISNTSASSSGYVGHTGLFGATGKWQANLPWSALGSEGAAMDLFAVGEADVSKVTGGSFNYSAGVLTWQTTSPVPEPSVYMVALAGLAVLTFAGRRRNGK